MKNSVIELILKIKECPGMYIGTVSVERLRIFLEGYFHAMRENGLDCEKDAYDEFNKWFRNKYQITDSILWDRYLSDTIHDQNEAFNTFMREFEMFLDQKQLLK